MLSLDVILVRADITPVFLNISVYTYLRVVSISAYISPYHLALSLYYLHICLHTNIKLGIVYMCAFISVSLSISQYIYLHTYVFSTSLYIYLRIILYIYLHFLYIFGSFPLKFSNGGNEHFARTFRAPRNVTACVISNCYISIQMVIDISNSFCDRTKNFENHTASF